MNIPLHRHDILFLSPQGHEYAWQHRKPTRADDDLYKGLFFSLPCICRAQEAHISPGLVSVGFSLPVRTQDTRKRFAAQIPRETITQVVAPWEIPSHLDPLPSEVRTPLNDLALAAGSLGISFGIYGSAAMQALTGHAYLHSGSDLDICLVSASRPAVERFYALLAQEAAARSVCIDAELMVSPGCCVKLQELMSGQKTVLAKGSACPRLLSCQSVWDTMAALLQ